MHGDRCGEKRQRPLRHACTRQKPSRRITSSTRRWAVLPVERLDLHRSALVRQRADERVSIAVLLACHWGFRLDHRVDAADCGGRAQTCQLYGHGEVGRIRSRVVGIRRWGPPEGPPEEAGSESRLPSLIPISPSNTNMRHPGIFRRHLMSSASPQARRRPDPLPHLQPRSRTKEQKAPYPCCQGERVRTGVRQPITKDKVTNFATSKAVSNLRGGGRRVG